MACQLYLPPLLLPLPPQHQLIPALAHVERDGGAVGEAPREDGLGEAVLDVALDRALAGARAVDGVEALAREEVLGGVRELERDSPLFKALREPRDALAEHPALLPDAVAPALRKMAPATRAPAQASCFG